MDGCFLLSRRQVLYATSFFFLLDATLTQPAEETRIEHGIKSTTLLRGGAVARSLRKTRMYLSIVEALLFIATHSRVSLSLSLSLPSSLLRFLRPSCTTPFILIRESLHRARNSDATFTALKSVELCCGFSFFLRNSQFFLREEARRHCFDRTRASFFP